MLKKLFENTSTKGTFKPIFPIYSLSDLYIIQKRAHNIKSRKTDEWGINGPISWTRSTKNVSKSPNLHPQWGRITLFTLLWDTLYVCFSIFFFWILTSNFDRAIWFEISFIQMIFMGLEFWIHDIFCQIQATSWKELGLGLEF